MKCLEVIGIAEDALSQLKSRVRKLEEENTIFRRMIGNLSIIESIKEEMDGYDGDDNGLLSQFQQYTNEIVDACEDIREFNRNFRVES